MHPTSPFARLARLAGFASLAIACDSQPSRGADTAAEPPAESPMPWAVDAQGIGRVRTGITVAQLGEALGAEVKPVYDFNPSCTRRANRDGSGRHGAHAPTKAAVDAAEVHRAAPGQVLGHGDETTRVPVGGIGSSTG